MEIGISHNFTRTDGKRSVLVEYDIVLEKKAQLKMLHFPQNDEIVSKSNYAFIYFINKHVVFFYLTETSLLDDPPKMFLGHPKQWGVIVKDLHYCKHNSVSTPFQLPSCSTGSSSYLLMIV